MPLSKLVGPAAAEGSRVTSDEPSPRPSPLPQQQQQQLVRCCTPRACSRPSELIDRRRPDDAVPIACSNERCGHAAFMHRPCFREWEESILVCLRSTGGRSATVRGGSDCRQQPQSLVWPKKGDELAFKACECRCAKGQLRQDRLDSSSSSAQAAPATHAQQQQQQQQQQHSTDDKKPKRNRKRTERPSVVILASPSLTPGRGHPAPPLPHLQQPLSRSAPVGDAAAPPPPRGGFGGRLHTSSFSSTGSSPPRSTSPPPSSSADEDVVGTGGGSVGGSGGCGSSSAPCPAAVCSPALIRQRHFSFSSSGAASDAKHAYAVTGNIFCHRENMSVFNCLPLHKRNGYHIKMEDEGPFVNDETRCFVLSNLSAHKAATVQCVVCSGSLVVYDRYPLIDGTFFLTPVRHPGAASVVVAAVSGGNGSNGVNCCEHSQSSSSSHGAAAAAPPPPSSSQAVASGSSAKPQQSQQQQQQYMAAVCMHCLLGWTALRCRGCRRRWDGSALVLGTMYAYDVFAAQPCCAWRLLCRACRRPAVDPSRLPSYFSEFSRPVACQHCRNVGEHFVQTVGDAFYLA